MSFPVAVQSAIFYLVACTPCAKVRHRQKARDQAKKERAVREKLEMEQPGLYRHPSPFNTNPFWQEEINMGPSLPKKSASKNSSQRGLASSGSGREDSALSISTRANQTDSRLNIGGSTTATDIDQMSENWNTKQGYQREDEELWGQWSAGGHKIMDALTKARDSAGRMIESTLGLEKEVTEQERRDFYFAPRNPPVNDYHPPVVSSKTPNKDAHRWMLQPPPAAKFMEGKVPVNRASSAGSKSSGVTLVGDDSHMSRLAQEKVKKMASPTESELIDSLFATRSSRSLTMSRTRSWSFDHSSHESLDPQMKRWSRRSRSRGPTPAPVIGYDSDSDLDTPVSKRHTIGYSGSVISSSNGFAARRPRLATIRSGLSNPSSRASSAGKVSRRQQSTQRVPLSVPVSAGPDSDPK